MKIPGIRALFLGALLVSPLGAANDKIATDGDRDDAPTRHNEATVAHLA